MLQDSSLSESDYVRQVLNAYRRTPTTAGRVNRQDRLLAVQLYRRGVPLSVIENALLLGAARRLYRDLDAPPLPTVRSLHYFLPIIEEVLGLKISPQYFEYVRYKIDTFEEAKRRFLQTRNSTS
jgi:hypothetical protein